MFCGASLGSALASGLSAGMCDLRKPQGHSKLNLNALPSPGVTEPLLFLATAGHSGLPGIDRASCSQSAFVRFSPSDGGAVVSLQTGSQGPESTKVWMMTWV